MICLRARGNNVGLPRGPIEGGGGPLPRPCRRSAAPLWPPIHQASERSARYSSTELGIAYHEEEARSLDLTAQLPYAKFSARQCSHILGGRRLLTRLSYFKTASNELRSRLGSLAGRGRRRGSWF